MFRPIGGPKMDPKAPSFEPGKPWPGQAKLGASGLNPQAPAFEPGKPWTGKGGPAERPNLRISIPDREPLSPQRGSNGSPPRTQEEWNEISQNLRRHQALPHDPSPIPRPGRPTNPLRPGADERANAGKIETEITEKKQTKSDMLMFFDNDIPHEAVGKRAPTPGETAALKDFDTQRRAYRDPETGENFGDLRNRGEFSATYDVRPALDGSGRTVAPREFRFDRGNTSRMEGPSALPPHMRIHSHPDFTLPIPSPQDHRVAARNYAAHGEKNYLVTSQNSVLQFGPGKNGPEYTKLSPIDIKTPTAPPPPPLQPSPRSPHSDSGSQNSDEYWRNFPSGQAPERA